MIESTQAPSKSTWLTHAQFYRSQGWVGTLPLRPLTKWPPPTGFTGWEGIWPSEADVHAWESDPAYGTGAGMALRLPLTVVGIDVDDYDSKVGAETMRKRAEEWGPLPPTYCSTSRDDGASAISFYRVPEGLAWPGQVGRDVETIHYGHRYAVVWPSIHPEGRPYTWRDPAGDICLPPKPADLAEMPSEWVQGLTGGLGADPARKDHQDDAWAWVAEHEGQDPTGLRRPCSCTVEITAELLAAARRERGAAHEALRDRLVPAVRLAERGCTGVADALSQVRAVFVNTTARPDAPGEFDRMLDGAVAIVAADPRPQATCQDFGRYLDGLGVEVVLADPGVPAERSEAGEEWDEARWDATYSRVDWGKAWLEDEAEDWIVEPLLARGRSVALYSAPKVGKSLLALEVAAAIASGRDVLGTQVTPCRVLYVDMENNMAGDIVPRLKRLGYQAGDLHALVYLSFPVLGALDQPTGAAALVAAVEHYQAEVVVVDTISRLISGEENANDTWLGVYRHLGAPLKARGVAVLRLDHSGKDETKGMRGGSAKYGDVDAVWRMSKLTEEKLTLQLEAMRMPIAEKFLTLNRTTGARLHHAVDPGGKAAAYHADLEERVRLLDEMDVPVEWGDDRLRPALKDAGQPFKQKLTREAQKARRDRSGVSVLSDSSRHFSGDGVPVIHTPSEPVDSEMTGLAADHVFAGQSVVNPVTSEMTGYDGVPTVNPVTSPPPQRGDGMTGQREQGEEPEDQEEPEETLSACRSCYRPTPGALCPECARAVVASASDGTLVDE